jgi:hypothetical protein
MPRGVVHRIPAADRHRAAGALVAGVRHRAGRGEQVV